MHKIISVGIFLVAAVGNVQAVDPKLLGKTDHEETPHFHDISTEDLAQLLESGKKVLLVDARLVNFDDGRRLPDAKLLPFDSSREFIEKALPNKKAIIVTYCFNEDCPSSHNLAMRLANFGYTNVYAYPLGIQGWLRANKKLEIYD